MTIPEYREDLLRRNPCAEGVAEVNKCRSRKDFFELIGKPIACGYFLKSIRDGWGPSTRDFEALFRPYINGSLTIKFNIADRTYRSQIWCNTGDVSFDDSVRWLILIGCRGCVRVRNWQVVKIFVDKNSQVDIESGPNSIVYVENYGGQVSDSRGICRIKQG